MDMIRDSLTDVREKYRTHLKMLGQGHFGVVRDCMHKETKKLYAIKTITKKNMKKPLMLSLKIAILREVLRKMNDPYIMCVAPYVKVSVIFNIRCDIENM